MKVFSENTLFLNFKCNFVKNTCQKNDLIIVKNNTKITSKNLTFGKSNLVICQANFLNDFDMYFRKKGNFNRLMIQVKHKFD